MNGKKVLLIIMDGWGLGQVPASDAIQHAQVPFVNSLWMQYPHTTLVTFGEAVVFRKARWGTAKWVT